MNKLLNVLYYILFVVMLFIFAVLGIQTSPSLLVIILVLLLFLVTLITTIIDICKSRIFSLKHNIFTDIVLLIMVIICIRPIIDSTIFTNDVFYIDSLATFYHYCAVLYNKYIYVMPILIIIIFISNYLDYKLCNLNR